MKARIIEFPNNTFFFSCLSHRSINSNSWPAVERTRQFWNLFSWKKNFIHLSWKISLYGSNFQMLFIKRKNYTKQISPCHFDIIFPSHYFKLDEFVLHCTFVMIINIFIKQKKKNKNMNIEKVYELFFSIFVCIQ